MILKSIIRASGEVPLPAYLFPHTGRMNFSGGIFTNEDVHQSEGFLS
jgi:hypothetical protein